LSLNQEFLDVAQRNVSSLNCLRDNNNRKFLFFVNAIKFGFDVSVFLVLRLRLLSEKIKEEMEGLRRTPETASFGSCGSLCPENVVDDFELKWELILLFFEI